MYSFALTHAQLLSHPKNLPSANEHTEPDYDNEAFLYMARDPTTNQISSADKHTESDYDN
jgi:hypothetical protein